MVGNKSRVFKVIKTPVDTQEPLPAPMKDILGYDFFTIKDGAPLEFDPAYGQEYAQLYNQNVAKLAWEITQLLKTLEAEGSASDGNGTAAAGVRASRRSISPSAATTESRRGSSSKGS